MSLYTRDADDRIFIKHPLTEREFFTVAEEVINHRYADRRKIETPADLIECFRFRLAGRDEECFTAIFLDTQHQIISVEDLFQGSIDGAEVHPRGVVKRALILNAAAVAVGHQHPSGIAEPSAADRAVTLRLRDALALVDVRLLDHVVIGGNQHTSLAARGWL